MTLHVIKHGKRRWCLYEIQVHRFEHLRVILHVILVFDEARRWHHDEFINSLHIHVNIGQDIYGFWDLASLVALVRGEIGKTVSNYLCPNMALIDFVEARSDDSQDVTNYEFVFCCKTPEYLSRWCSIWQA